MDHNNINIICIYLHFFPNAFGLKKDHWMEVITMPALQDIFNAVNPFSLSLD